MEALTDRGCVMRIDNSEQLREALRQAFEAGTLLPDGASIEAGFVDWFATLRVGQVSVVSSVGETIVGLEH